MNWWRHVVEMELRKILAYRSDFWITFLGQTLLQLLIARALWEMIFATQGATEMQGFTLDMMYLYYLIVPIGTRMLAGENIGFFAREIYEGTFSRYLLYPLSVFQYKILTYMTHSMFYGCQLVLIYLLYRVLFFDVPLQITDVGNLFLGTALFSLAALAYCLLAMLIELISLWADNIWSLIVMLRFFTSFFGGGLVPLSFLPEWARSLLTWTPFPYLVDLPARTVMGLTTGAEIANGIMILFLWILIAMGLVKLVWMKGEKQYTGVGI